MTASRVRKKTEGHARGIACRGGGNPRSISRRVVVRRAPRAHGERCTPPARQLGRGFGLGPFLSFTGPLRTAAGRVGVMRSSSRRAPLTRQILAHFGQHVFPDNLTQFAHFSDLSSVAGFVTHEARTKGFPQCWINLPRTRK